MLCGETTCLKIISSSWRLMSTAASVVMPQRYGCGNGATKTDPSTGWYPSRYFALEVV